MSTDGHTLHTYSLYMETEQRVVRVLHSSIVLNVSLMPANRAALFGQVSDRPEGGAGGRAGDGHYRASRLVWAFAFASICRNYGLSPYGVSAASNVAPATYIGERKTL